VFQNNRAHSLFKQGGALSVLVVLSMVLAGCGGEEASGGRPQMPIPAVEVVQAHLGALPLEQRLSGVVQARNQVTIFPELSGQIEAVMVENGDFVERGQPLVRLNARQFQEQLRQAEAELRVQEASAGQATARLRELRADLSRVEQLAERQLTSQLELEQLRARVEAAEADQQRAQAVVERAASSVEERRDALSRTVIRAPVSGVVGRRNAEVGMRADGSTPLLIVGDLSEVRIRVMLTEHMLGFIGPGQTAHVWPQDGQQIPIEAKVDRISPFLEAGSFSTEATIDVRNVNGRLRPGMYVDVAILYGESEQATIVPNSALFENPRTRRMAVFVAPELRSDFLEREGDAEAPVSEGLSEPMPIQYREVEVIARGREQAGISGIEPGDWVVVVGHDLVQSRNGGPVMARTRPIEWDRLISMQALQQQDLLRQFMRKQQEIARVAEEATASAR
jgi:HlyD family secretion protein